MISATPVEALILLRQSGSIAGEAARVRLEQWAIEQLDRDPEAGACAILDQWNGLLDAGGKAISPTWLMPQDYPHSLAVALAADRILAARPDMPIDPLRYLLGAAAVSLERARLADLAESALKRDDLPPKARALWSIIRFGVVGESARDGLDGHAASDLRLLLGGGLGDTILDRLPVADDAERASRSAAIIRTLGPDSSPDRLERKTGRMMRPTGSSDAVHKAVQALQANPDGSITALLDECLTSASLALWHPALRHARAVQMRLMTDTKFTPPTLDQVLGLLGGGPPVNATDLRAIIVDELRRLGRSLREDAESPWLDYWNTDDSAKPLDPKVENVARNTTLTKLRSQLARYDIAVTMPEVQRKDGTRVDLYLATATGRNLPIEAKRHFHPDLWTAAEGQLQDYTTSEGATGIGVLLVFWFGSDWTSTPTRSDGKKPESAAELEALLVADLPEELCSVTDVVVLDVSRPEGGEDQLSFAKRMKEPNPPRPRRAAKAEPKTNAKP